MNSEEKYNAALERAKRLYGQGTITKSLEYIFPELAEPEDEKMWKLLKRYAQYNISDMALNADHITREQLVSWLEKQSERMSNKVEPKFHKGDWVVSPDNSVFKITHVNSHNYTLHLYNDDYRIFESERWYIDKEYRLWTIYDAKDGDVLAVDNKPFIYNGNVDSLSIGGYCGIDINGLLKICEERPGYGYKDWTMSEGIYPATKEQHDLLFHMIREAGYEWDAEEKVLVSILVSKKSNIWNQNK